MGPPSAIIFLVAIIASALIGGVGPGLLTSVTLHIAHGYLFIDPSTGGYYVVGIIVGVLSQKRASALARARAEHTDAVAQRERLRATLGCIADGVIVTNTRPLASWSAGCLEIASRPQSRPYY
jgi:K+-sensing histidine kinase KdpD